jgi:hypothetical protein
MLERYANEWIVEIADLSDFVAEQRQYVQPGRYERLLTPREAVLAIDDPALAARIGLDSRPLREPGPISPSAMKRRDE